MATLWDCGWKCEGSPDTRDSSHEPPSPHTVTEIDRETVTQTDRQKVIQIHRTAGMSLTDINTDNVLQTYGVVSTSHLLYTLWQKQTGRQTEGSLDTRDSLHEPPSLHSVIETDRQTGRQRDRQTYRQTNSQTDINTDNILQTYGTVSISHLLYTLWQKHTDRHRDRQTDKRLSRHTGQLPTFCTYCEHTERRFFRHTEQ